MSEWSDVLAGGNLLSGHRFSDGIIWAYAANGITEAGAPPRINTPDVVNEVFSAFGDSLRSVSFTRDLPIDLLATPLCMIVDNFGISSATHYVNYLDGFTSEEETPQLAYVGCTGLRYDRVRALIGPTTVSAYVSDPLTAIDTAALHILSSVNETRLQPPMVAAAYNTDGVHIDQLSRWKMSPEEQINRWVSWFNTAVNAVVMNPTIAGTSPSFAGALATIGPTAPRPPSTTTQNQKYFKLESQAAVDAGMMTICESNPQLSTIWALDDVTTTQITNLALGVGAGQGLPMGQSAFAYPDRNRTMRLMNPDEIQKLYRAMRDYVTAIILYDTGHSPSLPGQPVFIP